MRPDLQNIDTNGIRLRVALAGQGPLVILIHGFPESWYSWRHQIPALADAGYRVAAPDVRGYGGSDKPLAIEAYSIKNMCADIGGSDCGAGRGTRNRRRPRLGRGDCLPRGFVSSRARARSGGAQRAISRSGADAEHPTVSQHLQGSLLYQLYFQEPGVAEAELEADVLTSLRKVYYWSSGERQKAKATIENPIGPGLLDRLVDPNPFPIWLTEADLDYFASQFRNSGFRGPLNRYRNSERDFEQLAAFDGKPFTHPTAFMAGSLEPVLRMIPGVDMVELMRKQCADLRYVRLMEDAGHWLQQERPAKVNAALLEFLRGLPAT